MAHPVQRPSLREATAGDAPAIAALVDAAYSHYTPRIGTRPGPMLSDYAEVVAHEDVTVADLDGVVVGVLVLAETAEGFVIDNIAVDPAHQGTGLGRVLLERAEQCARSAGYNSLYLYTHETMVENLALYARIGYVEYDRRAFEFGSRVFLRKQLG